MPSTLGYAVLAGKVDKKSNNQVVIRGLVRVLKSSAFSNKSTNAVAEYLYSYGFQLVSKTGISLDDYYEAVATMLNQNMIPFDCAEINTLLMDRINRTMENICNILGRR